MTITLVIGGARSGKSTYAQRQAESLAAESGSRPDDITVTVHDRGDNSVIEVADRGSGLGENVLRDALLPFYSTKATGTGLGLTLCREIVEAHGGRLSLANRPDGPTGAVVTLWIPSAAQKP